MKTQVTVCSDGSEVRQTEIDDLKRTVQDLTLELQLLETQVTYTKKNVHNEVCSLFLLH
jgi:hypothetical protein